MELSLHKLNKLLIFQEGTLVPSFKNEFIYSNFFIPVFSSESPECVVSNKI